MPYGKSNKSIQDSAFKMKGWSPFTQKTHPKHPVTPPTKEESKKSKGTLSGSFVGDFFEGVKTGMKNINPFHSFKQEIKNR